MDSIITRQIAPNTLADDSWCLAFYKTDILLINIGDEHRLSTWADLSFLGQTESAPFYLGQHGGQDCFALRLQQAPPEEYATFGLRQAFAKLEPAHKALAAHAIQMLDWDENHRFCGRCGELTHHKLPEPARVCAACGLTHYPRISPAIMVRIEKNDEILLARSPHFRKDVFGLIAGFVEPGETLEQALHREVFEEVGIYVENLKYFGSHPWPFPNSLMVGFTAQYQAGEINIDGIEIESAAWYHYNNLPILPDKISIARQMIDDFVTQKTMIKSSG